MMTPDDIDVWVHLDVGKGAHHAHALDRDGDTLYDKPLKQDEKAIRSMLEHLSRRGRVLPVVDQPNTIGSLPLTVARDMGITAAYLPGTAMRRTAQLPPETLRDAGLNDETLAALKLLAGHDEDLANFKSAAHLAAYASIAPVIGAWITLLKLDKTKLDASQQLVLEFASSGILGLFGKASSIFTTQGIESIKRSTLPETISHLTNSLDGE